MRSATDGTLLFEKLAKLGYVPIPIVPYDKTFFLEDGTERPGGKSPGYYLPSKDQWRGMPGWQDFFENPPQELALKKWSSWNTTTPPGVGLLTGNLVAIDIDITHPELAAAAQKLAHKILGPTSFTRIGNAPKTMLIYRTASPIAKFRSGAYTLESHNSQRIEILGKGQQFVAFGTHPTTKQPYEWPLKSITEAPFEEIPLTDQPKLQEFISSFDLLAADIFGATLTKAAQETNTHITPSKPEDTRGLIPEAIKYLPQELAEDHDSWIKVGLALKAALPHDESLALTLWDEFSQLSPSKYDPEIVHQRWGKLTPSHIGAGTLYKLARDYGWQPPHVLPPEDPTGEFDPLPPLTPPGDWVSDFEGTDLPPRQWLLGRHLLRGQVTTMVAPGGVGKSTLTLAWAASIASKRDITDAIPHETGKIWIINNEDDSEELRRRFIAVKNQFNLTWDDLRGRIKLSGSENIFKIARRSANNTIKPSEHLKDIIEEIKSHNVVALIVDPLVSTHPAEENNNNEMEEVMMLYRQIARETNCAVCLVHHTSKPQGGSSEGFAGNANAGRGASAVVNAARISLTLFDMSQQDAATYGITDELRGRYARLDDAKANLSLKNGVARWFYRESVNIGNGDEVGVLRPEKLIPRENAESFEAAAALGGWESFTVAGSVVISEAVKFLQDAWVLESELSSQACRARVIKMFQKPVAVGHDSEFCVWYEKVEEGGGKGKPTHFLKYGKRQK
jgi:hypothetical protein